MYLFSLSDKMLFNFFQGGKSRDLVIILNLYSDRTGRKIFQFFFNTQWNFMRLGAYTSFLQAAHEY